jgi:hypothetical protein
MNAFYLLFCLVFLGFLITFGIDREIARSEYVKLLDGRDYEKKIEGCLYSCNCRYYTELLWKK